MIKKDNLIKALFIFSFLSQIFLSHLSPEIKYPLFLLINLLLLFFINSKEKITIPTGFFLFYVFYIFAIILSGIFSPNKFQFILELIKNLSLLSFVILSLNILKTKNSFRPILISLILMGAFLALGGINEYTGRILSQKILPLSLPFNWPDLSASFFMMLFPLTLFLDLNHKKNQTLTVLMFVSTFLILTAWLLSRSLVWSLPLFFFAALIVYKKLYTEKFIPLFLLLLLVVVTFFNFVSSFGLVSIVKETALFQESIYFFNNKNVLDFSFNSIKSNFLFGVGPGTFAQSYKLGLNLPWTWSDFAKNELLQTFVETGIGGFITQLILFLYLIIYSIKMLISSSKKNILTFPVSFSVVLFLVVSFFTISYRVFPLQVVFFLLVAFIFSESKMKIISQKITRIILLPILLITTITLTDSYLLQKSQDLFRSSQFKQSQKILLSLTKRPDFVINPKVYYWLAAIELNNKNIENALKFLDESKKLDPNNFEIDYQIASYKYKQKNLLQAKQIMENLTKTEIIRPPKYYLLLAQINFSLNNPQETFKILRQVETKYPFQKDNYEKYRYMMKANNFETDLKQVYLFMYKLTNDSKYFDLFTNLL